MSCCRKQRNVRGLAGRRAGGRVRPRYRRRTALAVAADAGPLCRHRHRWTCAITTWLHTHAHIIYYTCAFCTAICTRTNAARARNAQCIYCGDVAVVVLYSYIHMHSGILHSCMLIRSTLYAHTSPAVICIHPTACSDARDRMHARVQLAAHSPTSRHTQSSLGRVSALIY